jgi:hypothetical protein
VAKLSGAAAAAQVQQSSATSALKDNEAVLKALHNKLAQHDKQEVQHKMQVEEGTKQLRKLQEAAAAAQKRLSAESKAANAAAQVTAGAGRAGADRGETAEELWQQQQRQMLQQQEVGLERELQLMTACKGAAAEKATRAAKSVEGLQQKAAAAKAAAAEGDRTLAEAGQEVQAAAAAMEGSRQRSLAAEKQWRTAHFQQQLLMVSSVVQDALILACVHVCVSNPAC